MEMLERFKTFLSQKKLFHTRERQEIAIAIEALPDCFEPGDIEVRLRKRGCVMAESTIYRNLRLFMEAGLVSRQPDARGVFRKIRHERSKYRFICGDDKQQLQVQDADFEHALREFCSRHGIKTVKTLYVEEQS